MTSRSKVSIRKASISHSALLSVFFLAGLEIIFALQQLVIPSIIVLAAISVAGVILIRYEELGTFRVYQSLLPILAVVGLSAFALFQPFTFWLHAYIAGSTLVLYFILAHSAKHAYPTWNTAATLIVLFVTIGSIFGSRFHLYIPIPIILPIVFVLATLIAVQGLIRRLPTVAESWYMASIVGLVIAQTSWVLQFLPLHFYVQAGIILTVYYALFGLVATAYERSVGRRDVIEYLGYSSLAFAVLLLSARWQ